ncbi:hypothetical protein GJ496_011203 [Pomphorhynchus laevis]|nr:hypothetical protein GJ496_011203 [Pomphorhynchus laevis]
MPKTRMQTQAITSSDCSSSCNSTRSVLFSRNRRLLHHDRQRGQMVRRLMKRNMSPHKKHARCSRLVNIVGCQKYIDSRGSISIVPRPFPNKLTMININNGHLHTVMVESLRIIPRFLRLNSSYKLFSERDYDLVYGCHPVNFDADGEWSSSSNGTFQSDKENIFETDDEHSSSNGNGSSALKV